MRKALLAACLLFAVARASHGVQYGEVAVNMLEPFAPVKGSYGYGWAALEFVNDSDAEKRVTLRASADPSRNFFPCAVSVSRSYTLPPKSRSTGTWLLPAAIAPSGRIAVEIDGQRQLTEMGSVPESVTPRGYWRGSVYGEAHPVVLGWEVEGRIRDGLESLNEEYDSAVKGAAVNRASTFNMWRKRATGPWPEEWLGYSRALAVVLTPDEWWRLNAAARVAMLEYVSAGGAVLFVGEADLGVLARDLPGAEIIDEPPVPAWRVARLGLGTLSVTPADAALDGDAWDAVLRMWEGSTSARTLSMSAARGEALLPLLARSPPPARMMLGGLLLFSIIIGPLNMIVLARLRRRVLLFVTTPLLGCIAAITVLGYGVVRDGITPIVRTRSVTLLDQRTQVATTLVHEACFAPLTPGAGLTFDLRCMVIPSTGEDYGDSGPRLVADTSGPQRYASGLVTARSANHFRLVRVATQRERIVMTRKEDGRVEALNGLGAAVSRLIVADQAGAVFVAENIPAGATAVMAPVPSAQSHVVMEWASVLEGVASRPATAMYAEDESRYGDRVPRNGYVAMLGSSLFIETGFASPTKHDARSVVIGRFGED